MIGKKPDRVAPTFDDVDMSDLRLPMLTVYNSPKDYAGKIVVRVWDGTRGPTDTILIYDDMESCRAAIPDGFIKLARLPGDDPVIAEVYI